MANQTAWNVLGAAAGAASLLNLFGPEQPGAQGKLNSFLTNIRKGGVARTNRFLVVITPPRMMTSRVGTEPMERLCLLCESGTIPGLYLTPTQVKRYGVGMPEDHILGAVMQQQTFSFIGDGEGFVHKFFYNWLQGIVKTDRLPSELQSKDSYNGLLAYEVEYKANYASMVDIYTYNEQDDKVLHIKLHDAFPFQLGDVQLSWGDGDQYMRIPITFSARTWEIYNIDEAFMAKEGSSNDLSAIQKIVKGATIVQTVAAIRKPQSVGDYLSIASNAKTVVQNIGGLF